MNSFISIKLPATLRIVYDSQKSAAENFVISYFFTANSTENYLSCKDKFFTSGSSDKSFLCPAGCEKLGKFPVIGGKYSQYSEKSSVCRSAIHSGAISGPNGGRGLISPQRSPLDIRETFFGISSNAIRSRDGPGGQAFQVTPIENFGCPSLPLEFEESKISASSYLEKFAEPVLPGIAPVETVLNWHAKNAVSKSATPWAPSLSDKKPWIQLDFGKLLKISKIETSGSTIFSFDFKPESFTVFIRNGSNEDWLPVTDGFSSKAKIFEASGQPSR